MFTKSKPEINKIINQTVFQFGIEVDFGDRVNVNSAKESIKKFFQKIGNIKLTSNVVFIAVPSTKFPQKTEQFYILVATSDDLKNSINESKLNNFCKQVFNKDNYLIKNLRVNSDLNLWKKYFTQALNKASISNCIMRINNDIR